MRNENIKIKVKTIAHISAMTIEAQMPSTPMIKGKTITETNWKNNVLKKAINAEINPLLSPVKNDDPNIENPVKT